MFSTMPLSAQTAPLPIIENTDTGDRFLVYHGKEGVEVELLVLGESFCATQAQMAQMFGVTKQAISKHLKPSLADGERIDASVVNHELTTGAGGKAYRTQLYHLNRIIAVGYRVEGKLGTMFRVWATDRLFQYLTNAFAVHMGRMSERNGE